jgi:colanic acid/amylovoran biosynthesis protein
MRIAITNCVVQNGGDAAIAFAIYRHLREAMPDASIECHDARPAVAAKYYPEVTWKHGVGDLIKTRHIPKVGKAAVRLRELPYTPYLKRRPRLQGLGLTRAQRARLEDFAGLDAIVSTGGTYLIERYLIEPRLFEYRMAQALGIPVFFYTQSLGPFANARNQRVLRDVFNDSPLVLLRDERSARHLDEIHAAPARKEVVADAVFAEGEDEIRYPLFPTGRPLRVGISVRAFPPAAPLEHPAVERFAGEMARGVEELVERIPMEITFVSTCQGVSEYWCDDSLLASRINERLTRKAQQAVRVDTGFHTPPEFRELVEGFDLFISTRMHGAIQALVMNTPVIPISYEFKTDELFKRLGMSDFVLPIDEMTAEQLIAAVTRLLREFNGYREMLATAVLAERAVARHAANLVSSMLTGVPDAPGRSAALAAQ